jgi:hypothetical protein
MFAIMTTGIIQPKIRRNSQGKIASGYRAMFRKLK